MEKGYLRLAVQEDMDLLFQWANEVSVRANSFSTDLIAYEEHREWYQRILLAEDCRQYIYMYNGEAIGQARVTISGITAEVSYSICAEQRCMGHGKVLLRLLCDRVRDDFPEVQKMTAKVKPGNIASQKAFLDIGYVEKCKVFELDLKHGKVKEK